MSTWTHVIGSMSLDSIASLSNGTNPSSLIESLTGEWENPWFNTFDFWDNPLEHQGIYGKDYPKMPQGSEGPLMYEARNLGAKNSLNNCVVTFFGNLRDFDNDKIKNELIPYFNTLLDRYTKAAIHIRGMSISIDCGDTHLILNCIYNNLAMPVLKTTQLILP